jgi:hypothetical protein
MSCKLECYATRLKLTKNKDKFLSNFKVCYFA